jgi:hypothetical protein
MRIRRIKCFTRCLRKVIHETFAKGCASEYNLLMGPQDDLATNVRDLSVERSEWGMRLRALKGKR